MLKDEYIKCMSTLTNLPVSFLTEIYKLNMLVISNELHTQMISDTPDKRLSLATYGEVRLHQENNNLIYKFIPSDEFNSVVRQTIISNKDMLETKMEDKLVSKLYANYSDFMEGSLTNVENAYKMAEAYNNIEQFVKNSSKISKKQLLSFIHKELVKSGMKEVGDGRKEK